MMKLHGEKKKYRLYVSLSPVGDRRKRQRSGESDAAGYGGILYRLWGGKAVPHFWIPHPPAKYKTVSPAKIKNLIDSLFYPSVSPIFTLFVTPVFPLSSTQCSSSENVTKQVYVFCVARLKENAEVMYENIFARNARMTWFCWDETSEHVELVFTISLSVLYTSLSFIFPTKFSIPYSFVVQTCWTSSFWILQHQCLNKEFQAISNSKPKAKIICAVTWQAIPPTWMMILSNQVNNDSYLA